MCRGLVFDPEWNLVGRPLPKFFNYEEHLGENAPAGPLPTGMYSVEEKYDGSLGIVFRWNDELVLATRGSFHSYQAERGMLILEQHMRRDGWTVDTDGCTHLFEIIYPENRIVVDYGATERLQWLTSIHTASGAEHRHHGLRYGWNNPYPPLPVDELKKVERHNAEGYVLRFESGERVKIKFAEYVRLHALVTGLDTVRLWETLRDGKDPLKALESVPDELYGWAEKEVNNMVRRHGELAYHAISQADFIKQHLPDGWTRKDFAARALQLPYKPLYFLALDGNTEQLGKAVWALIKPERKRPTNAELC
jgi:RNA ligase